MDIHGFGNPRQQLQKAGTDREITRLVKGTGQKNEKEGRRVTDRVTSVKGPGSHGVAC